MEGFSILITNPPNKIKSLKSTLLLSGVAKACTQKTTQNKKKVIFKSQTPHTMLKLQRETQ